MLDSGSSKPAIAKALGICTSSVYNELRRGTLNGIYDPEYAEGIKQTYLRQKGPKLMLEYNPELVNRIAVLILNEHLSPERIIERFKQEGFADGEYPLSDRTIYTAIDRGLIPNVTRDSLNADTTSMYDDVLRLPTWFRNKLGLRDGDIFKFESNDFGQIILTKTGNKRKLID
ncbi:MAG: hypothetical protein HFF22_06300 [Oscillospiraceae bacterium]|jgi:IS30 family transposase|nr:hypothetical protein [Oscillospiraceae bacterium]